MMFYGIVCDFYTFLALARYLSHTSMIIWTKHTGDSMNEPPV